MGCIKKSQWLIERVPSTRLHGVRGGGRYSVWSRDCLILSTYSTSGLSHCIVGLIARCLDNIRVTVETKHGLMIKVDTSYIIVYVDSSENLDISNALPVSVEIIMASLYMGNNNNYTSSHTTLYTPFVLQLKGFYFDIPIQPLLLLLSLR